MTISELIEVLERILVSHGNFPVEVRNAAGDWDEAETVNTVNYGKSNAKVKCKVLID